MLWFCHSPDNSPGAITGAVIVEVLLNTLLVPVSILIMYWPCYRPVCLLISMGGLALSSGTTLCSLPMASDMKKIVMVFVGRYKKEMKIHLYQGLWGRITRRVSRH